MIWVPLHDRVVLAYRVLPASTSQAQVFGVEVAYMCATQPPGDIEIDVTGSDDTVLCEQTNHVRNIGVGNSPETVPCAQMLSQYYG